MKSADHNTSNARVWQNLAGSLRLSGTHLPHITLTSQNGMGEASPLYLQVQHSWTTMRIQTMWIENIQKKEIVSCTKHVQTFLLLFPK
jgi:hypothetical protein